MSPAGRNGWTETWRVLQATVSHTHCEIWWRVGDDLGGFSKAGIGHMDQDTYKVVLEENLLLSALTEYVYMDNNNLILTQLRQYSD